MSYIVVHVHTYFSNYCCCKVTLITELNLMLGDGQGGGLYQEEEKERHINVNHHLWYLVTLTICACVWRFWATPFRGSLKVSHKPFGESALAGVQAKLG